MIVHSIIPLYKENVIVEYYFLFEIGMKIKNANFEARETFVQNKHWISSTF